MEKHIWAVVFLAALVGFFLFIYQLNRKTPVPEGCEDLIPDCHACSIHNCAKNLTHTEGK